jgi:NADPH:quinone reductase-like Zn-dependent oxidoreductase
VDRGEKLALMRSLGAERVIDFAREDFVALPARYDAILDMSCHRPPSDYRRVMKPRGRYAILGGDLGRIAQVGLRSLLQRLAPIGQSMRVVAVRPNVDNRELAERVTRGDLSVVIDQSYPLEAAAEALQRVGDGTAAGKLVIRIAEASPPR